MRNTYYSIRDWLSIGAYRDCINLGLLKRQEIGAILQLADTVNSPNVVTKMLLIDDGVLVNMETLAEGITFIRTQKAEGKRVLVACGAGISRSTTFALGALKEEEDGTILDNFLKIREHHPNALPHIRLWHSLNTYYGERIPYDQVWQHSNRGEDKA